MTVHIVTEIWNGGHNVTAHATAQRAEVRAYEVRAEYPDQEWHTRTENGSAIQDTWTCDDAVVSITETTVEGER